MRPTFFPARRAGWRFAGRLLALALAARLAFAAAPGAAARPFDVPAGEAVETLRQMARQGEAEIVFLTATVRGVRTPAVRGEFTLREALDRLVAGTALVVRQDPRTGGLSVERSAASPPSGAAPAHAAPDSSPTMKPKNTTPRSLAALLTGLVAGAPAVAQTAPAAPAKDEAITLSPFVVETEKDTGYAATSTLAGSRLNTELKDTPAAISVMTREFLIDIGAVNVTEALGYGLNVERDFSDFTGNGLYSNDLLIQMRGFVGASLGRNYFGWFGAHDSYNVERLDFSRGPNSILFGVGGPGGIVNTTTKQARLGRDRTEAQLRVASWDDTRATIDVNRNLGRTLALRLNGVWQEKKSWRDFEYQDRLGGALALTYRPFRHTTVRLDSEHTDIKENKAQPWPAADRLSPWLDAGSPRSATYGAAVAGTGNNTSRAMVFDPASGLGPISYFGGRISNTGPVAIGLANNPIAITDERLLPRRSNLAGPAFANEQYFYNYAVFVEQRLFDQLDLELAFNRQHERRQNLRPIVFDGIALRGDPNALLPDGRRNPNAGRHYVEGTAQLENRNQLRDDYRFTASYQLDLTRRSPWLGRHRFAGLLARRNNTNDTAGNFTERNVTPQRLNNAALYPNDLTSGNNTIVRRTYLDFSGSDLDARGLHDIRRHLLTGQNGVTSGWVRNADSSRDELTRLDSTMAAVQSSFWRERLWLTGGVRTDKQRAWGSGGATQDPVTREWGLRMRNSAYTYNEGSTRTYGGVLHAAKWLSFYYNNSTNFIPNSQRSDLVNGDLIGNRIGEGQDAGLKLRLLGDRITANLGWYETTDQNRQVGIDAAWTNHVNAIWRTLGQTARQISVYADSQDLSGDGYELELTANLTPEWRTSLNWSITNQITDNVSPRTVAYMAAHRATWQAGAALELDRTGTTLTAPTVAAALQNATVIVDSLLAGNGNIRRGLREHSANLFTNYNFARDSRFAGLGLGAGVNYRGDAVLGYDSSRRNQPILGSDHLLVNAMVRYARKITARRLDWRIQLNIDNALGEDRLLVTDANQDRAYRFVYLTPRRWSISNTISF
jgi:outer membrane receptor protein involved in Fe transport